MSAKRRHLVLQIVAADSTFEKKNVRGESMWVGKCIHCNSALTVSASGETFGATIEHILPTTHGGTDEVNNVALACPRCNQRKGARLDARPLTDPTLAKVIETLRARKLERTR